MVIGIIAILAAMLIPALESARSQALLTSCAHRQKQLYLTYVLYAQDYDGFMPQPMVGGNGGFTLFDWADPGKPRSLAILYSEGYLTSGKMILCPDHNISDVFRNKENWQSAIKDLVEDGEISGTWNYGPTYWVNQGMSDEPTNWPNAYALSNRLWDNTAGNYMVHYNGVAQYEFNLPAALPILACGFTALPESAYEVYRTARPHDQKNLNTLYADGVVKQLLPAQPISSSTHFYQAQFGPDWLLKFDKINGWSNGMRYLATQHPSWK